MIKQKIKDFLLKIEQNKTNKIEKELSKPIKNFDEAITRAKSLISIGKLKEASSMLDGLLLLEIEKLEKSNESNLITLDKKEIYKKEFEEKKLRIKNLLNLIKAKKLGISFTNINDFGYSDSLKIITKNLKDNNFSDAKLVLLKLRQKEQNLYERIKKQTNKSFFSSIKNDKIFSDKIKNLYEKEILIYYSELFLDISKYSNTNSIYSALKLLIKNKKTDEYEEFIPKIKLFEENLFNEISKNVYLSKSSKKIFKKRKESVFDILKSIHTIYYKEKTGLSIELSSVKTIKDSFIVISDFTKSYNFDKALKALYELRDKESSSIELLLGDQTILKKYKDKLLKKFRLFELKVSKIEKEINKKKEIYEKGAHKRDLIIRNKQVDNQLKFLLKQGSFDEALNVIENYKKGLGNDVDKYAVFCEKWKYNILRSKQKSNVLKNKKQSLLDQAKELMRDQADDINEKNAIDIEDVRNNVLNSIKKIYERYLITKKARNDRLLLDNIESLLKSSSNIKEDIIKTKLEKVHAGLIKDTDGVIVDGYSIYGKTFGADKISGDTFGFYDFKSGKRFFIGDATGHGIRAGFMVSLLTSLYHNLVSTSRNLKDLVVSINNKLKQDLKSGNFITSIFFELDYSNKNNLKYIGMGHEPMLFYKKEDSQVSKIYPGGVAAGMTVLKDQAFLKEKNIELELGDIILLYTDGLVEARNEDGDMFGIERISQCFYTAATTLSESKEIYNFIYNEIKNFVNKTKFLDDLTIIVIKRDSKKESVNEEKIIETILRKEHVSKKFVKKLKGKSKDEIENFLKLKRKERELQSILKNLKSIFKTGDLLVLKKECQRYIKEGFLHKDIVKYLSYAINNEAYAKIEQQNIRLQNKYETLLKLLKAGQYDTVLEESSNIIINEGKI